MRKPNLPRANLIGVKLFGEARLFMNNALGDIFNGLQRRLMTGLESSRSVLSHPVAKGDATEVNWLDLFQRHLPHRYDVAKAFVVDSNGATSDQIDIVVYDRL